MPPKHYDRAGFCIAAGVSLDNTKKVFECKQDANIRSSSAIPNWAEIVGVEITLTSIVGAASTTMVLTRDSGGDRPVSPGGTTGATQTIWIGATTGTSGGTVYEVKIDYNYDMRATGSTQEGSIYVVVSLNAGTATADIRVQWRG